jgi:enamine deaminase RidA (YjgF/YER057c/UK114 family)
MSNWTTFQPPGIPHPFALSGASDDWVLISGVGGHDPEGNISDDLEDQVRATVATMSGLLEQAGSSLSEIVWFRPLVPKREYAFEMDGLLRELFPEPKPVGGALIICELADPRMKVEMEAWAQRGAKLTRNEG